MALKTAKPACGNRTGLGNSKDVAAFGPGYLTFPLFRQEPIDIVDLLTARSGVAAATVPAHVEAFGLGSARHG